MVQFHLHSDEDPYSSDGIGYVSLPGQGQNGPRLPGKEKWIALILFCWFSINNGLSWLIFDSVATELSLTFPYLTTRSVDLLSTWQPLVYILAFYPMTRLQRSRDGLRKAVLVGAASELLGACCKVLAIAFASSYSSVILLHMGQIFSAVASPAAIGAPPSVTALWFIGSGTETRVTAAAVLSNNMGNALGYGIVPPLTDSFSFAAALWFEFAMATTLFLLAWSFYPSPHGVYHRHPVDVSQPMHRPEVDIEGNEGHSVSLFQHAKALFRLKSGVALCLCYAWSSGSYVAWTSLYEALIGGSAELTAIFVGTTNLISTIGYVTGGAICAALTDFVFHHKMKHVLIFCTFFGGVTAAGLIGIVEVAKKTCFFNTADLKYHCPDAGIGIKVGIVVLATLAGACSGGAAPVFYELIAEVSYPVPENVSGNILSLAENLGALLMYQVVARFLTMTSINISFVVGMVLCTLAILIFVKEEHLRPKESLHSHNPLNGTPQSPAELKTLVATSDTDRSQ